MRFGSASFFPAISVTVLLTATPASAQFYNLEGRFQCLTRPGAICFDATLEAIDPARVSGKPAPAPASAPLAVAAPAPVVASPAPTPVVTTVPDEPQMQVVRKAGSRTVVVHPPLETKPKDIKEEIAVRVQAQKLAEGDLGMLQSLARSGDGRALELLAWCMLQGIGTGRDPVQAYMLYGQAAVAKVPNAKANQNWIYKTILSSDERQQILMVENSRLSRG